MSKKEKTRSKEKTVTSEDPTSSMSENVGTVLVESSEESSDSENDTPENCSTNACKRTLKKSEIIKKEISEKSIKNEKETVLIESSEESSDSESDQPENCDTNAPKCTSIKSEIIKKEISVKPIKNEKETLLVESSEESSDSESDSSKNCDTDSHKHTLKKSEIMEKGISAPTENQKEPLNMTHFTLEQPPKTFTDITGPQLEQAFDKNVAPIIIVSNLPLSIDNIQIKQFFSRYGNVIKVFYQNKQKHFEVQYQHIEEAIKALEVNGMKYKGSRIEVALLQAELLKHDKGIVITDIPAGIGKDLLWETCEIFGPIENIYFSGKFALIIFENCDSVELALVKGHVVTAIGHNLKVNICNRLLMSQILPTNAKNLSLQPPRRKRYVKLKPDYIIQRKKQGRGQQKPQPMPWDNSQPTQPRNKPKKRKVQPMPWGNSQPTQPQNKQKKRKVKLRPLHPQRFQGIDQLNYQGRGGPQPSYYNVKGKKRKGGPPPPCNNSKKRNVSGYLGRKQKQQNQAKNNQVFFD